MAITITPTPEKEAQIKAEAIELGFPDTKKYVTHIVDNRHNQKYEQDKDLAQKLADSETELQKLSKRLYFVIEKAVKAGCNRGDLQKQLSNIN